MGTFTEGLSRISKIAAFSKSLKPEQKTLSPKDLLSNPAAQMPIRDLEGADSQGGLVLSAEQLFDKRFWTPLPILTTQRAPNPPKSALRE